MATYDLGTIGYTVQNTGAPKSIAELKEFARAGLEAHRNSTQLAQGNRLAQYFATIDKQITQVNRNMQNHNRYLAQAGQSSNRFGVVTQQAGYQIGDFLVQVQSGTNFLVAFGQQATQLVGILPLMGAGFMGLSAGALVALSAGLGIAIPLVTAIGAAFMRTGEDADSASSGVDKYKQALDALKSSVSSTQAELNKLTFGTQDDAVANARQAMLDAQEEIVRLKASQRTVRGGIAAPTQEEKAAIEAAIKNYRDLYFELRGLIASQESLAEAQRMLNGHGSTAAGIQAKLVADKQEELRAARELEAATANALQVYARTRAEAEQTAEQVSLIESGMSQAAVDALQFAGIDLSSGVSAAAREAATLAANMNMTLNDALSFINMTSSQVFGQVGARSDPRDFLPGGSKYQNEGFKPFVYTPPKSSGGGRSSQLKKEIELTKELTQAEKDRQTILKSIEGSLESGFMAMIDGTKSVKDAFKSMAAEILKELYRVLVVQRLVGAISGGIGMFSGPSTGSLGLPFGLATGGSMMSGQPYLVGEHGPELVIPRHSGTVVNANQTSDAMVSGGGFTQNLSINVSGSDAAMVRTEIAKMIPQITNATKAAVIDAKQRGGQMAAAFR